MQQLSGMDASFLYFETASAPMYIGGPLIYDQSTAPAGAKNTHGQESANKSARSARAKKLDAVG